MIHPHIEMNLQYLGHSKVLIVCAGKEMNARTTTFISIFSSLIGDMYIWGIQGRTDTAV